MKELKELQDGVKKVSPAQVKPGISADKFPLIGKASLVALAPGYLLAALSVK